MQIRKIRFENIHSLKGAHEIDFGDGILGEAGLFAIIGPTGSGKSTLLDVITLAIYNRIARVDKSISNTVLEDDGGIMTRNMKSCFAEVEYRVKGKDYRSHWSIERNRNNNLNARKQEIVEVATGTIIDTGTKTPDKNEEIIGLSYDQFVKAMVLSQGEFSKLLQAPRNERNKLLEDITGARSYREIGRAVFMRYAGLKKKVELKEAGLESIELLTPEIVDQKKSELKTLTDLKPEVQKSHQEYLAKIATRKELTNKKEEQKQLEINQIKLKELYANFKPQKEKLDRHEKLVKYSDDLRDHNSILKDLNRTKEELESINKTKSEEETKQISLIEKASKLLATRIDIDSAHEKLEGFRDTISGLQSQEKAKQGEAVLYQNQVKTQIRKINDSGYPLAEAETPALLATEVEDLVHQVNARIETSGLTSLEDLNQKSEELKVATEKSRDLLTKKQEEIRLQKAIQTHSARLKSGQETLDTDLKKVPELEKEILVVEKEIAHLAKTVEHQRKHQSLEDHRAELKPDEPCPLCGSLEHPYALENPKFDTKEELLKDKRDLLKTKSDLRIRITEKNKFLVEEIARIESEMQGVAKEEKANLEIMENLAKGLKWDFKESLDDLQNRRSQLINSQKSLENTKQAFQTKSLIGDMTESLKNWDFTLQKYREVKEKREKLYSGTDISQVTNRLTTDLTRTATSILSTKKQLHELGEKLKSSQTQKSESLKKIDEILVKENLETIEQLQKGILPEEEADKYRKRNAQLEDGKARLSEQEKNLKKTLDDLLQKDDDILSDEALNELFKDAETAWNNLSLNIGKITQSLDDDQKTRQRQQTVLDELNRLKKDLALWKTMNDLIGDSNGNKFSNFVQDLTLEQLIGFANKRLEEFSDRYLLDIPTADEADKSDTLKVFDKYMGNARRSVRTLSGGETFLVSLAMAFALSDIASRNVKIESLFIDEGFGTLDPETLDQAITILEKMQNEGNKSVGIISHVGALKERITTQIQLEKSSLGYSTIRVVQ
ncbi:AAA family ATPase [Cryomorpha ignava]|uniref:AAA family ATPase n=1 Tax=Cryomorpha ignava TaxID=101383 RepID=A0A7K3WTQ8_9FLAO|nr:AAA family ATPase [Cryomorpha ignava]NEN25060.1 AAA family ATPase [Cryomorpha ignava]